MSKYFVTSILDATATFLTTYYSWAKTLTNKKLAIGVMLVPPVFAIGTVNLVFGSVSTENFNSTITDTQIAESTQNLESTENENTVASQPAEQPSRQIELTARENIGPAPNSPVILTPITQAPPVSYRTCKEFNAAGYGDFRPGDPEYTARRDRDNDGIACEF